MVTSKQRDLGLDLLRIISMLMVVTIHYFGNGGLMSENGLCLWSPNWFLGTTAHAASIVCNDLFVMISGYYLCTSTFRLKKLLSIWLTVAFYSVGIYLVLCATGLAPFSVGETIKHCMPFTLEQYWFVTPYLMMYALTPLLNSAIRAISQKQHLLCCMVSLILFCALPNIVYIHDFVGESKLPWFCTLYMIAAYSRHYVQPSPHHRSRMTGLYLCMIGFVVAAVCLAHLITPLIFGQTMLTSLFLSMDSIPMAIAGIALFEVFRTIRVSSPPVAPIIRFAAPSAFSVYLISHHPELKVLVWSTLRPSALANSPWLVFHFLISITGIFFVCCVIDLGRQWLFKLLRIDQLLQRIDDLVCRTTEGWMSRFLQAR